jgi:DNA-binding CsgD family transcriptional regulator
MPLAQFIEKSHQTENLDALAQLFCQTVAEYGYHSYCCFSVDGLILDTEASVTIDNEQHYDKEFIAHYKERDYIAADPIYKLFWCARGPFTWEQVLQLPLNKKQQEVMEARKNAGCLAGVGMPVQSTDPKIVGMNVKSKNSYPRTDKDAIAQIYAACNQFQLQRAALLSRHEPLSLPNINLTPREKEMLLWCSQGKSNSVIGDILGIAEKTVEFHFKSIFKKLDVTTRTTAVLKAVHLKLIHIEPAQLYSKSKNTAV